MTRRWFSLLIILTLTGISAGCGAIQAGVAPAHSTHRNTKPAPSQQPTPVVVDATPPVQHILTPTQVISPPNSGNLTTSVQLRAPLVPGTGLDSISVTVAQQGHDDTLTVRSASGNTLWTVPHIGQVSVAEYGKQHLPVLLLGTDQSLCGTGGCGYVSYTYSVATHTFVAVPFSPWQDLSYQLNPRQGNWTAIPAFTNTNVLLGYASLTAKGISISFRLYGALNGGASQRYIYALDGTATGEWLPAGSVNFGPDAVNGFVVPPTTLQEAATEYLAETMQNHPTAASTFVASSANSAALESATAFMRSWGLAGNLHVAQALSPTEVQVAVWTTIGSGPTERLQTDVLDISGTQIAGKWYLTQVTVSPQTERVGTVQAALALLAKGSAVQALYAAHPSSTCSLQGQANGWSAYFSTGVNQPGLTFDINAQTGAVSTSNG